MKTMKLIQQLRHSDVIVTEKYSYLLASILPAARMFESIFHLKTKGK